MRLSVNRQRLQPGERGQTGAPGAGRAVRPLAFALLFLVATTGLPARATSFDYVEVDASGPLSPWGKAVGDLNGDGLTDLVVGGHQQIRPTLVRRIAHRLGMGAGATRRGELVWYAAPDWVKHTVSTAFNIRTDIETGDLDGDGQRDIVALTDQGVVWFRAPDWVPRILDPRPFHDLELADLDDDGRLDLVLRSQSLFGHEDGNRIEILTGADTGAPLRSTVAVPHGEGLLVHDLDGDGTPEIIVNSVILRRSTDQGGWQATRYTDDAWRWQDVFIGAGDMDHDGRIDIVLAPAEEAGEEYRISWFRAPADGAGPWRETIVEEAVEAVHHFVGTADFDGDGRIDIATAQMNQGADPDEVAIYRNLGSGKRFARETLAATGSHSMRIFDADGDFDPDLFGANWHRVDYDGDYAVQLWRNVSRTEKLGWSRHVIDQARPGQALFVLTADIDGDARVDIVSGAYWYRNPGHLDSPWRRRAIGSGADNAVLAADFDSDGRIDLLASGWRGYGYRPSLIDRALGRLGLQEDVYGRPGNQFVLARNAGPGGFEMIERIERARGDFLQGVALIESAGRREVALSFHQTGSALQALVVPPSPTTDLWRCEVLSPVSQNEALSAADFDGDGDMELVTGTRYLEGQGRAIRVINAGEEAPDRHRLADINGDGMVDVVVGYESPSRPGKVAWYQRTEPGAEWIEHEIAQLVGPMSLDAGDIDGDGDMDVVVGEHSLVAPQRSRLVWLENRDGRGGAWSPHLIHTGDEHHDGARLADIDSDGDLDVVSIGWTHGRVLVYENRGVPLS